MKKLKILQLQILEETETFLPHSAPQKPLHQQQEFVQRQSACLEKVRQKLNRLRTVRYCFSAVLLLLLACAVVLSFNLQGLLKFKQTVAQESSQPKNNNFVVQEEMTDQGISQPYLQIQQINTEEEKQNSAQTQKSQKQQQNTTQTKGQDNSGWKVDGTVPTANQANKGQGEHKINQSLKQQFEIQPNFWLFSIAEQKKNYYKKLLTENNKYFASLSNYTVNVVTFKNYQQFLLPPSQEKVANVMKILRDRLAADPKSNLKPHMETIEKMLSMFSILYDHGGIIATESFTITENFDWLRNINQNIYLNRGNYDTKPQVVGFFSPYYSSPLQKHNKKTYPGMQRVDQYMVEAPTMQSYFVAAKKNTQYIGRVIEQMIWVLMNHDLAKQLVINNKKQYTGLPGTEIYFETYLIAAKKAIIEKQKQLDTQYPDKDDRHYAIDYFGILTINCHYAPLKIKVFWQNNQAPKIVRNLVKYDMEEYYANVGRLRYIDFSTVAPELNSYLEQAKKKNGKNMVMKGSFIQRMYFPNANQSFIYENKERPFINTSAEPWSSLPKIIWVFWDTGIKNSRASTQLCVQNLRRMAALSGIEVKEVNNSNLATYLDEDVLKRINQTVDHVRVKIYPQSRGDMYRLSLLIKYGGIYIDSSYFALDNFDWLLNIASYPTQYIFNRYGNQPKVVMYWHPHYGSPFDWVVDEQLHTKVQWHLAYQNNFIAAQKGAEFVKQWLDLYLSLLVKPYDEIAEIFKQCQTYEHRWISSNSQYLLAMDSAKCVIGRKQLQIQKSVGSIYKSASDYYKIWSMSGYLGQQKFRPNTNFDYPQSFNHTLLYRYPQQFSEGLVGKVMHLTKLYNLANKFLNAFIGQHLDGDFRELCHSQSIFIRHLFNKPYKLALNKKQAIILTEQD